jgi:hypothetical protein
MKKGDWKYIERDQLVDFVFSISLVCDQREKEGDNYCPSCHSKMYFCFHFDYFWESNTHTQKSSSFLSFQDFKDGGGGGFDKGLNQYHDISGIWLIFM